jgi:hypothetical protein
MPEVLTCEVHSVLLEIRGGGRDRVVDHDSCARLQFPVGREGNTMDKTTPMIIYVPGLGHQNTNTADGVAEVLARAIDRRDVPRRCSTKLDSTVSAPRVLKVAKTIVDEGDKALLQLFELDYGSRLEKPSGAAGPPAPPGVVQSTKYVVFGALRLAWAWKRPAKTLMTKLQLWLGFAALLTLILAWLVALYAALISAGLDLPKPIGELFGKNAAGWTFGISGTAAVVTWAALRKNALAFASTIQHLIDYTRNSERTRDTVCLTLDDAIAGLLDDGWKGKIHLLGYSFGSLLLYDAAFPHPGAQKRAEPFDKVASLVTVGCPLDLVRLYYTEYSQGRQARASALPWKNIYNAADVFGSNLQDKNDVNDGKNPANDLTALEPESIRYLQEELSPLQLFMARGFRTHAGYWGTADEAHCFEKVLDIWLPT